MKKSRFTEDQIVRLLRRHDNKEATVEAWKRHTKSDPVLRKTAVKK